MALVGSTGRSKKAKRPSAKHNRGAASNPNMTVSRSKPTPESGSKPASSRPRAARKGGLPSGRMMKEAMHKPAAKKAAKAYLAKSSGTTTGEVRGVLKAMRKGDLSKGGAIKALKGGPTAGVKAGNKRKVAKAIKRARSPRQR